MKPSGKEGAAAAFFVKSCIYVARKFVHQLHVGLSSRENGCPKDYFPIIRNALWKAGCWVLVFGRRPLLLGINPFSIFCAFNAHCAASKQSQMADKIFVGPKVLSITHSTSLHTNAWKLLLLCQLSSISWIVACFYGHDLVTLLLRRFEGSDKTGFLVAWN